MITHDDDHPDDEASRYDTSSMPPSPVAIDISASSCSICGSHTAMGVMAMDHQSRETGMTMTETLDDHHHIAKYHNCRTTTRSTVITNPGEKHLGTGSGCIRPLVRTNHHDLIIHQFGVFDVNRPRGLTGHGLTGDVGVWN